MFKKLSKYFQKLVIKFKYFISFQNFVVSWKFFEGVRRKKKNKESSSKFWTFFLPLDNIWNCATVTGLLASISICTAAPGLITFFYVTHSLKRLDSTDLHLFLPAKVSSFALRPNLILRTVNRLKSVSTNCTQILEIISKKLFKGHCILVITSCLYTQHSIIIYDKKS